jgi:AcrR family transcriptional regulator
MLPVVEPTTRDQILRAASELFSVKGYYGTTTREIAGAVGVRQPALFHHFPSKAAILEELIGHSVDTALATARALQEGSASPAVKLYQFLAADLLYIHTSPYNLTAIHTPDIVNDDTFSGANTKLDELYVEIRKLVEDAMSAGEIRDMDPELAQELIVGATKGNIRFRAQHRDGDANELSECGVAFIMKGLLTDPSEYERIRREAFVFAAATGL